VVLSVSSVGRCSGLWWGWGGGRRGGGGRKEGAYHNQNK
jgi:hypothetical protein